MEQTILFVDNRIDFLDVHARLLEYRGYTVIQATSVAEAKNKLQQFNIQLAILDIRLEDDDDELDISGLVLAQNEAYRYLPKIMLTAHPSWEYARVALGVSAEGLNLIDMIAKNEGTDKILDAVDQAFAKHVQVNWSLDIRSSADHLLTVPYLVASMSPILESGQLALHTVEVQELLSRLFLKHDQISLGRLIARIPNRVWFTVSAFNGQEDVRQYLVTCGQRSLLLTEQSRLRKLVPKNNNHYPLKQWQGATAHYAAYASILPGISNFDNITTLLDFYRRRPIERISKVIRYLFEEILFPWYQDNPSWENENGVAQLYELWLGDKKKEQLETELAARIQSICEQAQLLGLARLEQSPRRLTLHLPQQEPVLLPNPSAVLAQVEMETTAPVLFGMAHGRLDGTAVLADDQENCWLIDYAHVKRGALLQDFVCLETAVKYDMLAPLSFSQRYDLESRLLAASSLTEAIVVEEMPPEIIKAVQTITLVRKLAATTGINANHYQLGLLLHTLGRLFTYQLGVRHTRQELTPYLHSLVSTAMIYQRLTAPSRIDIPSQALYGLWVDEEKQEVWVEGQAIELTPQEFDLLHYLYRHVENSCSRDAIMKDVFGLEYAPDWSEKQRKDFSDPRINSAISRLRKKIEPDSNQHKYIKSVWGSGYKLDIGG